MIVLMRKEARSRPGMIAECRSPTVFGRPTHPCNEVVRRRSRRLQGCLGARRGSPRAGPAPADPALAERYPVGWPVRREDLADEVVAGNRPPLARVARLRAVVAHHEVARSGHLDRPELLARAPDGVDVRLFEL